MEKICKTKPYTLFSFNRKQGFTLIETMVAIAVVAVLAAIAVPRMDTFLVKMRVDNEISEIQRLLLTARNMAINTGKNTTVCPLSSGACTNNWKNKISVFTNGANTLATNNTFAVPDELVKIKEGIKSGDLLQYAQNSVIFAPDGRLLTASASFRYCPKDNTDYSRGITLSTSGRSYTSTDTDNDGKDEDRNGVEFVCI